MGNASKLVLKGKLRLCQLAGIDLADIVVPFTKDEIHMFSGESEHWQRACGNFLEEVDNKYPQRKRIQFIKKTDWSFLV